MQQIIDKQAATTNEKLDITNDNIVRLTSLTESILVSVRSQLSNSDKLLKYTEQATALRTTEQTLEAERDRTAMLEVLKKIAENTSGSNKHVSGSEKDGGMSLGSIGAIGTLLAVALGGIAGALTGYVQTLLKLNKILFSAVESAIVAIGKFFPSIKRMLLSIELNFTLGLELIKNGVKTMFSEVAKKFASAVNFVTEIINKVLNTSVVKTIVEVFNKVVGVVKAFFEPIRDAFKVIQGASGTVGGIVNAIKSKIGVVMEFFAGIGKYFGGLSKIAKASFTIFKTLAAPLTIIMTLWEVISGAMKGWSEGGLVGAIGGIFKGLFNSIVFGLADMVKGAISWIAGALGFEAVEKFLDSFSFQDLFSDFVDAVLFIPQTIQNLIMHPIDTLKKLGATLKNVFDAVVSKFTIFADILSGIGDLLMDYVIDPLMNAFAPIADFFKGVKDQILGFVENFGIPEIGFTIPIINKKVSIGPFYPFKSGGSPKGEAAVPAAAVPADDGGAVGETLARAGNKISDTAWMAKENAANLIDANTGGALTKTSSAISGAKNKLLGMLGMGDTSKVVEDASGTKTYDKAGKLISEKTPTFMGSSTERRADGSTIESYDAGPMSLRKETTAAGGRQTTGTYDIGVTKLATRETLTPRQMKERAIDEKMAAGLPSRIGASGTDQDLADLNSRLADRMSANAGKGSELARVPKATDTKEPAKTATKTADKVSKIAGEPWAPGTDLSKNQLAVIEHGIAGGTNYSFRVMEQYDKQKGNVSAAVTGGAVDTDLGPKATAVPAPSGGNQAAFDKEWAQAEMASVPPRTAGAVYDQSSKNAEAQMKQAPSAPVIVSAPTSVNNSTSQSIAMPAPIRNDDSGMTRYITKNARYF